MENTTKKNVDIFIENLRKLIEKSTEFTLAKSVLFFYTFVSVLVLYLLNIFVKSQSWLIIFIAILQFSILYMLTLYGFYPTKKKQEIKEKQYIDLIRKELKKTESALSNLSYIYKKVRSKNQFFIVQNFIAFVFSLPIVGFLLKELLLSKFEHFLNRNTIQDTFLTLLAHTFLSIAFIQIKRDRYIKFSKYYKIEVYLKEIEEEHMEKMFAYKNNEDKAE